MNFSDVVRSYSLLMDFYVECKIISLHLCNPIEHTLVTKITNIEQAN